MANTSIRTVIGQFTADTSTFDLTVGGETRTPTGLVVMACEATALDTPADDLVVSFGVTDFTDVGQMSASDEHGVATTDTHRNGQETNIIEITDAGTATLDRTATVAAITGGVRFTPGESGTQHRVHAVIIFGSACKAFASNGDGSLSIDETFTIAHGMSTEPGAGFYGFNLTNVDASSNARWSLGFHAYDGTISQACAAWSWRHGQTTTNNQLRSLSDRCAASLSTSGGETASIELTAIDTTNCTYTNRSAVTTFKYYGLLVECDDVATDCQIVDSPTSSAADWTFTGLSFQPQFVAGVLNRASVVDNNEADADAGPGSFMAMDEDGSEHSTAWASDGSLVLGTTNTSSELAQGLFLPNDLGGNTHLMVDPTFTATGWTFTAANITSANGTARKWPMLMVEEVTAAATTSPDFNGTGRGIGLGIGRGIA